MEMDILSRNKVVTIVKNSVRYISDGGFTSLVELLHLTRFQLYFHVLRIETATTIRSTLHTQLGVFLSFDSAAIFKLF